MHWLKVLDEQIQALWIGRAFVLQAPACFRRGEEDVVERAGRDTVDERLAVFAEYMIDMKLF